MIKKSLKCVFLLTTAFHSFPSVGSSGEIDFKDGTVGYSLSEHLNLMKPGSFPSNKDSDIGFYDTESVPPFETIREAESYKVFSPDTRHYTPREEEDGSRYQLDDDKQPESILRRINLEDGRERVHSTAQWPYSAHGHMVMQFAQGHKYASGILVGPHHVITAAHNIYSHKVGEGWPLSVTFSAAQNERELPYGSCSASLILTFNQWKIHKNEDYDLALLILDEPVGYKAGWYGLRSAPKPFLENNTVTISGYPGDKFGANNAPQLWSMSHTLRAVHDERLGYDIDTYAGQSGSGIFYESKENEKSRYYVLGVHTYGHHTPQDHVCSNFCLSNQGTRLSLDKFNTILAWLETYQEKDMIHPCLPSAEDLEKKRLHRLYKQQAIAGSIKGQLALGYDYRDGRGTSKNDEKSFKWFMKAALQGSAHGEFRAGVCYYVGEGVEQSDEKAAVLYGRSAEKDFSNAQCSLGGCYYDGKGVIQDYEEARKLYEKAANAGHPEAQVRLGFMYEEGAGVTKDIDKAFELYRSAAKAGGLRGLLRMGKIYKRGELSIGKDDAKSMEYYAQAAKKGSRQGQLYMGIMYEDRGDYAEAIDSYSKAAENGYAEAQRRLAMMYEEGKGVDRDGDKAVEWYTKSANAGGLRAMLHMGIMHEEGKLVVKSSDKAAEWYRKAADAGYAEAEARLKALISNPS